MFCPKCNKNFADGQFCSVCGTTLIAPAVTATETYKPTENRQKPKKKMLIIFGSVLAFLLLAGGVTKVISDKAESDRKDKLISSALEYCDVSESEVVTYDSRHVLLSNYDSDYRYVPMTDQACIIEELGAPSDSYKTILDTFQRKIYRYGDVTVALDFSSAKGSTAEIWVK